MTDQERFDNQKGLWQPLIDELQAAYNKNQASRFIYLIRSGALTAGYETLVNEDFTKGAKSCMVCIFYPKSCGYWDKALREAHPDYSWLHENARHNCTDFRGVGVNVKP